MSAGHLSRQFRLAYGESPYSYLMTRRIERAMALLRRGDLSVTEVCFAVGCSSLGTFSTRFTELVGMPPSTYRRHATRGGGDAALRGETGDQTDQESRSARHGAAINLIAWTSPFTQVSSHTTIPTHPWPSTATPSASRYGPMSEKTRCAGSRSARRPARHINRPRPTCRQPWHHRRRATHHHRDDGKGHIRHAACWPPKTSTVLSSSCKPATPKSSRNPPNSRTAFATAPSAILPAT